MISLSHTDYTALNKVLSESKEVCTITFNNAEKKIRLQGPNKRDLTLSMVGFKKVNPKAAKPNLEWKVKDDKIVSFSLIYESNKNTYLLEKYKDGRYRKYIRLSAVK